MPNLAVIDQLKKQSEDRSLDLKIHCVCSTSPLDRDIITNAGLSFTAIYTWKLRRYFSWKNVYEPFLFIFGFFQTFFLLLTFRPHIIFLKGGFVCVPVALAGFLLRKPMIAHESDSIPGLANRIAHIFVKKVCTGFRLKGSKYFYTGNPIREKVTQGIPQKAYTFTDFNPSKKVILIIGGSQGALFLNKTIEDILPQLVSTFNIIHIAGKGKQISFSDLSYKQYEFLGEELFDIYAITDLAITRGGANSLAELSANHIPMIIIPHPASNNHQWHNAKFYADNQQALVFEQKNLTPKSLQEAIHTALVSLKPQKTPHEDFAACKIAKLLLDNQ